MAWLVCGDPKMRLPLVPMLMRWWVQFSQGAVARGLAPLRDCLTAVHSGIIHERAEYGRVPSSIQKAEAPAPCALPALATVGTSGAQRFGF